MKPLHTPSGPLTAALVAAAVWAATALPAVALPDDAAQRDPAYRQGQQALDRNDWDTAREVYESLAAEGGADADAALYWQAYAEHKAGDPGDALETLHRLFEGYVESAWIDDGRALEIEIRSAHGEPVSPALTEDQELKLLALDGLMHRDSEQALGLLEQFLEDDHPPQLTSRALFVLGQSDSPKAMEILVRHARSSSDPGVRREAVRVLSISGAPQAIDALSEIYRETSDFSVRQAVLQGYLVSDAEEPLLAVAENETDPKLRDRAIQILGAMGAASALGRIYQQADSREAKGQVLKAMGVAGDTDGLLRAARQETDPELRAAAVNSLGIAGDAEALKSLYRERPELRASVIRGLFIQGSAESLIELFREERDPELQRQIVRHLTLMDSPEANALLMEILDR